MARTITRRGPIVDPRVVGGTYLCGYWGHTYRVDAIEFTPGRYRHLVSVTETHLDGDQAGRTVTHCTSWDRFDRIVSTPDPTGVRCRCGAHGAPDKCWNCGLRK